MIVDRQPSTDKPWLRYYRRSIQGTPSPEMSLYSFLFENNKSNMDSVALNYYGKKTTYRELFEKVDVVASALQNSGVRKGDIVSLCALNIPEFIYLLYAINRIGAVSNWIGLTSPESDLREQLVSTNSKIVFTVDIAYDAILKAAKGTKVETIISIHLCNSMPVFLKVALAIKNKKLWATRNQWNAFLKRSKGKTESANSNALDMAIISYTGGSTGVPKGVMLSNKALNSHYVNFKETVFNGIFSCNKGDRYLSGAPIFLVMGICACCHSPLCHAVELVLAPDPSPSAGTAMILKYKTNHVVTGRVQIEALIDKAQQTGKDLSFIRTVMYGGEETNKDWENHVRGSLMANNMSAPILNSYGLSETCAGVLIAPDDETDGLIPCANIHVKVVDPDNPRIEFGYNMEGELCVASEQLMLGYYKNTASEAFFEENGVRWLKTGDLALIEPDGIIKMTGRIKRIYSKLASDGIQVRVYPMRIEETIAKKEYVRKCAVIGTKDEISAYRTIAYIVVENDTSGQEAIIKNIDAYCRQELPKSHVPDEYIMVEELPLTRAGKIDYRKLEQKHRENIKRKI